MAPDPAKSPAGGRGHHPGSSVRLLRALDKLRGSQAVVEGEMNDGNHHAEVCEEIEDLRYGRIRVGTRPANLTSEIRFPRRDPPPRRRLPRHLSRRAPAAADPGRQGIRRTHDPTAPQAADALQPLIDLARQQGGRRRYDPSAGREVQHIFVVRGKLLSKSLLFDMALAEACTAAGLVDSAGKATITAHRFRHTIGTHLAEGGARIQTIMAVLGHATPNMSIIYSTLSDPTVKQQYQDALDRHLGPEINLAGQAADVLREHRLDPEAVSWLQTNFLKTELELGHCLRTPAEGPCECDPC